jgi:hypothetical protein
MASRGFTQSQASPHAIKNGPEPPKHGKSAASKTQFSAITLPIVTVDMAISKLYQKSGLSL